MKQLSPLSRRLLAVAVFVTLLPICGLVKIDLQRRYVSGRRILPPEGYNLPPAQVLRGLTFGYNEVGADLLWIRTIAYYANHLLGDRDFSFLNRHLKNIVALDDRAKHVYRYGAAMLVTQGEGRTNRDVLAAIELLEQGHRLYPDDWRFPLYIGVYYMSDMRSPSKEQRGRWRLKSADWITRATLVGATVSWLPSLAAKLYAQQGKRDVAILRLKELYHMAPTKRMKQQIAAKLKHLQAANVAVELRETEKKLESARSNSPLFFLPWDLFVLMGQHPLDPFSLSHAVEQAPRQLLR